MNDSVISCLARSCKRIATLDVTACKLLTDACSGAIASMKSQFKKADASGARYALVFGADEIAAGNLSIKDLRNASTPQRTVAMADWAQWAQSIQSAA